MKLGDKILYWSPRVLGIIMILIVSMFALDSFAPGIPVGKQILAFIIHLIPSFVLIGILILAWKKEFIGGIIFITLGIVLSPYLYIHNFRMNHSVGLTLSVISIFIVPFIITGVLFLINYFKEKRNNKIQIHS
jgi:hypothetical protein